MGLDVYAGPVSRYVAGDWQTIIQQAGVAEGEPVITVRPEDVGELLRALEQGTPLKDVQLSHARPAFQPIPEWKAGLMRSLGLNEEWDEDAAGDYYTDKPGWDGYGAVVLLAAYDEQPSLAAGAKVKRLLWSSTVPPVRPSLFGEAEAFKVAAQSPARYPTLLRGAEWCLPISGGPVLFSAPTPTGKAVTMGHVSRLLEELTQLNQRTLRMSASDIVSARQMQPQPGLSVEATAPFGLSVLMASAEFASAHRGAWIMDY